LREASGPVRVRLRFPSEPEQKIFRKHKKIPVSRWCERYRYVTMSVLPGRWRNEVTPYLAGIMDASFFPSVQTIILCKGPQVGGSESINNCLGYAIDRDPGPALCIYPDEQTARENSQDRIQPMIKTSPRLRSYMTGVEDDSSMLRISLQHMPIYMAWARSAARLANKPIRYLIFDETDKYPETAGKKETDPISLGEARTITYRHNRKIWKISTPTTETGNIWKALTTEAQVIFDFWATCPACGHHHRMTFGQIKWAHRTETGPDGKCHSEDPETIEAEKLAWYECPQCLAEWNDYDRDRAVRDGDWRDRKTGMALFPYLKARTPVKIGFHIPSWISPFVGFSTVAAAFLRGQSDLNKFKDFHNKHLAEPWKMVITSKSEEQILAARCELPPQTVPENALALTCGVDTQKHGFWFAVRAWAADMTSWLIHYGFLATEAELDRIIYETAYPVANSERTMRIFRALRDTGGGEKYDDMSMTEESYLWILCNRGRGGCAIWGSKGSSRALPGMLSIGNEILATPAGKKLPGALRIISIDTEKAKDQFHYRLQLASKDDTRSLPGALFLHAETGAEYAAQILAEEKQLIDKHEEWVNVHQRPNHLFDAEILAAACVEMEFPGGGLRLLAARNAETGASQAKRRIISKGIGHSSEMNYDRGK
jgi:phage terminase large subunit GpA-like protein